MAQTTSLQTAATSTIALPAEDKTGTLPLESAISQRRSMRELLAMPPKLGEISQLLWAAPEFSISCVKITNTTTLRLLVMPASSASAKVRPNVMPGDCPHRALPVCQAIYLPD